MIVEYYGVEENVCEWTYLQNILKCIKLNNDYKIHIVSVTQEWDYRDKVILDNDKKNIIIGLSDEFMTDNIPKHWRDSCTVFKAYLTSDQELGNVHSFPLGYNKKHVKLKNKIIAERNIDVFFAGHMSSANRVKFMRPVIEFFNQMSHDKRPKLDFNISRGFNMGLSGEQYSEKLHDSKIVVCPAGNVSMETFRHYEAMRSGAVVVSPKLQETKIYKDAAICQVEDWDKDVGNVIMDLLSDLDMLQLVQNRQQQTYNNRFKAESVAKSITNIIMENTCYEFLSVTK